MCSGRSSRTTNSARTMPCVFVFPPRSKCPGFQSPRICALNVSMMSSRCFVLVRLRPLLGQLEPLFVPPLQVLHPGHQPGDPVPEEPVEGRADERVDAALHADEDEEHAADPVEQEVAGVGRRQSVAGPGAGRHQKLRPCPTAPSRSSARRPPPRRSRQTPSGTTSHAPPRRGRPRAAGRSGARRRRAAPRGSRSRGRPG